MSTDYPVTKTFTESDALAFLAKRAMCPDARVGLIPVVIHNETWPDGRFHIEVSCSNGAGRASRKVDAARGDDPAKVLCKALRELDQALIGRSLPQYPKAV